MSLSTATMEQQIAPRTVKQEIAREVGLLEIGATRLDQVLCELSDGTFAQDMQIHTIEGEEKGRVRHAVTILEPAAALENLRMIQGRAAGSADTPESFGERTRTLPA